MKKIVFCIAACLAALNLCAQGEWGGYAKMSAGYESNILNSPVRLIDYDSVFLDREDLILEAPFYEWKSMLSYKQNFEKHRIRWYGYLNGTLFQGVSAGNTLNVSTKFQHEWRVNKKYRLITDYRIRRFARSAADQAAEPFQQINSYFQFSMEPKLRIRANKYRIFYLGTGYRNRIYDRQEDQKLQYAEWQLYSTYQQKLFTEKERIHKFDLEVFTRYRKYRESDFDGGSEESPEISYRTFGYFGFDATYNLPIGQLYYFEPGLLFTYRKNFAGGTFSYAEIRPTIGAGLENKRLKAGFTISYANRTYPDRISGSNRLVYDYWRFRLNGEYKLNKQWSLLMAAAYTTRNSTIDDIESRFFRSYENYWFKIGVKFTW